ncbi:MAG: DUF3307 domain-containing protein [Balneolaceae bacterium]|nr:DUF3307 domain-containing protein [Balneolaceae bacterium]
MILLKLIIAHLIGDFFLQTRKSIDDKEKKTWKSRYLFFHVLTHFVLILILLWDISYWPVALLIAATHFLIDGIKLTFQTEITRQVWFWIDQAAHFGVLIAVWVIFWNGFATPELSEEFWILLTGILILTHPTSIVMQMLMQRWSEQIETDNSGSLEGAGKYIGILERLFVYLSIISGNPQAVGFLLAAKSVFRFGDLTRAKDRKLTEYILIGTLLSFLIAIVTGVLTVRFLM